MGRWGEKTHLSEFPLRRPSGDTSATGEAFD
jgi:hypothetical protein